MKKTLPFLCIVFVLLLIAEKSFGQSFKYGVSAGFHDFTLTTSADGLPGSGSDGASGYYLGFFGEFKLANKIAIQPEIQFAQIFTNGGDAKTLFLPVMFKYYIIDRFNVQAGPMFDLLLDNEVNETRDFGFGVAFGGTFEITDKIAVTTKYAIGLNNRTPDLTLSDPVFGNLDFSTKFDAFQIGLMYAF